MTTPFPFSSGQVLTAAQMNAITELPVNDKTASYTLTAAEAGERVIMNSASATTITVNTNLFTAGQVIYITNKGAGVCTVTAGTATVSTTGSLALAQYASGVLYCISAGVFIFEAYGVVASAAGLTFITGATFTTVASVSTAANTFTATYANYLILLDVTSVSTTLNVLTRLRAAGTDASAAYWWAITGISPSNANNTTSIRVLDSVSTVTISFGGSAALTVFNPQLARNTNIVGDVFSEAPVYNGVLGGGLYNTTSYDAITFLTSTGTMSGNYRVYGLANS